MPTYTYKCPKCGSCCEEMHEPSDRLIIQCECGERMQWQFPCPALQTATTFLANRPESQRHGSGVWSDQLNKVIYSKDDIRRHCAETGDGCRELGIARREPIDDPLKQPYRPADDIVDAEVKKQLRKTPGAKPETVRAETVERLAGARGKRLGTGA